MTSNTFATSCSNLRCPIAPTVLRFFRRIHLSDFRASLILGSVRQAHSLVPGFSIAVLVTGCATPQHNYAPQTVEVSEPALGSVNTAAVGDDLLKQGHLAEADAVRIEKPVTIRGLAASLTLAAGQYLKIGDSPDGEFFNPSSGSITTGGLARADTVRAILVSKEGGALCLVLNTNGKVCSHEGAIATHVRIKTAGQDSFQQTLIYNGRVGGKINIAYREFSADRARPSFNNNVEYDLGESNVIAYKGAELEVIEATNQFIRYKVIKNFNHAEY